MSWTDERIESLKKLWADGLSGEQIAAELGGITRNAVIGKVHRLGLSHRSTAASGAGRPRNGRSKSEGPMLHIPSSVYKFEPVSEVELLEIPVEQRKTLLQLTEKTCHWPVGDPGSGDFFFCGGETLKGTSYCAFHSRVACQPADERRRRQHPLRR